VSRLDITREDQEDLVTRSEYVVVRYWAGEKGLELGARSGEDVEAEDGQAVDQGLLPIGVQLHARNDGHELEPIRGLNCDSQRLQSAQCVIVEHGERVDGVAREKLVEGVGG